MQQGGGGGIVAAPLPLPPWLGTAVRNTKTSARERLMITIAAGWHTGLGRGRGEGDQDWGTHGQTQGTLYTDHTYLWSQTLQNIVNLQLSSSYHHSRGGA